MSFSIRLRRPSLSWILLLLLACINSLLATGQTTRHPTAGTPSPHTVLGNGEIAISNGPSEVCIGTPATFRTTGPGCSILSWTPGFEAGEGTITTNGSSATVTWFVAGTYLLQVEAECPNSSVGTKTVTVLPPPVAGLITTLGRTAQATATSATICQSEVIELIPPAGSSNWIWAGGPILQQNSTNGHITIQPTAASTLYSLSYSPPTNPCVTTLTSSFTVNAVPYPGQLNVHDTDRFGPGVVTVGITDANPGYRYTWYETATSTAILGTSPTFTTDYLTQSRSYFVSASSCFEGERLDVPVVIRQIRITVGGTAPTAAVRMAYGASIVLQAETNPTSAGPYTWLLNEVTVPNQTTAQLTVVQPGEYSVRLPSTGPQYASQPVQVLAPFDAQSANGQLLTYSNDIRVFKPNVSPEQILALSAADRSQTVTYANGLGQPIQQIAVQAGPAQQDIVQHIDYAGVATSSQAFLPFPVATAPNTAGQYQPEVSTKLTTYYTPKGGLPFATTTLEASPLARPVEQTQPGQAWATHTNRNSYQTNTSAEVHLWREDNGNYNGWQWYAPGQLSKEVLLDSDNRRTEVFRDWAGRTVLQRKVISSPTQKVLDTYTVYSEAGKLLALIPPAAIEEMANMEEWNTADLSNPQQFKAQWLYEYQYDVRGRLIERKVPGAAPVYLIYDAFDRPILVQDGNHRATNHWLFTKFDAQNRPVLSGLYLWEDSQQKLRDAAENTSLGEFEVRTTSGYTTDQTFPAIEEDVTGTILSMTFYDDYDLDSNGLSDYAYSTQTVGVNPQPVATTQVRGLPTVSKIREVQPDGQYGQWLTTALFYDQYGNLIQRQSNNLLQNSPSLTDITTLVYREQGFVPQVLSALKTQAVGTFSPVQVRNRYAYDATGHVLQTWQQHQFKGVWEPEVLLASNHYDGLGELTQKKLHSRDGVKFLQYEDFAYNLHGQLTRINSSDPDHNTDKDLFGLELVRETVTSGLNNTARFDGGISAVKWTAHNTAQQNQPERERSYRFTYDEIGQLTAADYAAKDPDAGWSKETGAYDEKNITYDLNGNLLSLRRYTQATATTARALMDDLVYTYTGNQLTGIADRGDTNRGFKKPLVFGGGEEPEGPTAEYAYDTNGSVVHDANKNAYFVYNALNKIEKQTVGPGSIQYTYDAMGTVLKRETTLPTGTQTEYYVNGFVYETSPGFSGLRSVPTPEGRALVITTAETKLTYEYHLRDHQGNLRVAFRAQPGTEDLVLTMESAADEEGDYPKFHRVSDTRTSAEAYHGSASASVYATQPGPLNRVPVSHGDQVTLSVYYRTPAGIQYNRQNQLVGRTGAARVSPLEILAPSWTLAPGRARESGPRVTQAPGLSLNVTGLVRLLKSTGQAPAITNVVPLAQKHAYIDWQLYNSQDQVVSSGQQLAPSYDPVGWRQLSVTVDVNLSAEDKRTGYLVVQLKNDSSQPVYFDDFTIHHPQDQALVSQENHYYPFGMSLSGVGVNTSPAVKISKEQFNDGSALQDELLGIEAGVYSTFYRSYDPSIGRFMGVDPLADGYADLSPYHFSNNDPVNYNDPSGAEAAGPIQDILDWIKSVFSNNNIHPGWDGNLSRDNSGGSGVTGYNSSGLGGYSLSYGGGSSSFSNWSSTSTTGASAGSNSAPIWQPFTQTDLKTYYQRLNNSAGTTNQLGDLFEDIFEDFVNNNPELIPYRITRNTEQPARRFGSPLNGPNSRNTEPDFIGRVNHWCVFHPRETQWYESLWIDTKQTSSKSIALSYDHGQIRGHIDNLAYEYRNITNYHIGFRPAFALVTTAGVAFSRDIFRYSLSEKHVSFYHWISQYYIDRSGNYHFRFINHPNGSKFFLESNY